MIVFPSSLKVAVKRCENGSPTRQSLHSPGLPRPALVLMAGGDKPNESAFSRSFYKKVRALGEEYLASNPRSVA